jgi:hypothetical protein
MRSNRRSFVSALVIVCVGAWACAPAPTQPTVEIAPLPTHHSDGTPPPPPTAPPPHARPLAGGPDRDGDGIVDDDDKCPDEPEDHDGFEDDDGCPDPDNDRDGILDVNDQCPNLPGPAPTGCPHP